MKRSEARANLAAMAIGTNDQSGRVPKERPLQAVSLFTGAGGLDLGCERAGFETRAAVELDDVARKTLLANASQYFPGLTEERVFDDIVPLDYGALLDAADIREGEVDLVH